MSAQTPTSPSRLLLFSLIALLLGLLLIFGVCELLFRLFPAWVADPPAPPPHNYRVPDKTCGWLAREYYQYNGEMKDQKGVSYPLEITFDNFGFRRWGNPDVANRKKVLFLGDSYTAAIQTSDDRLFYKLLGDSLNIEVFAYGAAGFSNVQEYLTLTRYFDEVKPDLVVWQLCSNDFIDNYWALEEQAGYRVGVRRPYMLEDGSLTNRLAATYPRNVKPWSYFLYFILKRIAEAQGTFDRPPAVLAEKYIGDQNLGYEPFARSVRMTDVVFKKMKAFLPPQTRLLVFDADDFHPQYEQFDRLCRENQIPFADSLAVYLKHAERAGECVHADDGFHWNNRGNEFVAAFLKPHLEKMLGLVPPPQN